MQGLRVVPYLSEVDSRLRERFGAPGNSASLVSRIISKTDREGLIKPNPATGRSRRFASYLPAWACAPPDTFSRSLPDTLSLSGAATGFPPFPRLFSHGLFLARHRRCTPRRHEKPLHTGPRAKSHGSRRDPGRAARPRHAGNRRHAPPGSAKPSPPRRSARPSR